MSSKQYPVRRPSLRRNLMAAAVLSIFGFSGMAFGQATTGAISGSVPSQAGDTVLIQGSSGIVREVPVTDGRFTAGELPLGVYTVTLRQDGQNVGTRDNVSILVGTTTQVSFVGAGSDSAQTLDVVSVSASTLPTIDVANINSQTVITAEKLAWLPIAQNAEAIALLAPGVVKGSGFFGNYVSFGGSSVTENAYYIDGFNTTDPLSGFGGMTLPYGAIAQQQILTGGYGARYGRSDGGVISQVGKRGTNEWHFGGQVRWQPAFSRANPKNQYRPGGSILNEYNADDNHWETTYAGYVGGPLIDDKLFFFLAGESDKSDGSSVGSVTSPYKTQYERSNPSYYTKIDWNINDSNILEVTGARNSRSYAATLYNYDYDTFTEGPFHNYAAQSKNVSNLWVARYTGYISDNLTLTAMYGKLKHTYASTIPEYDPSQPYLVGVQNQNPALNGGVPILNSQTINRISIPGHEALNSNLRLNLDWRIGQHTISAGIDNQNAHNARQGQVSSGPGYSWTYQKSPDNDPSIWIAGGPGTAPNWQDKLWVGPPGDTAGGETGYYTYQLFFKSASSVRVTQRAQYIQDAWQVSDRWLVNIGLRNDQFINHVIGAEDPYLRLTKPQWAPRLGFSWDVNGDSSLKIYGNAGRYYLAMPSGVAQGAGTLGTDVHYTYSGIDSNGIPTGLVPIDTFLGPGAQISSNGFYGVPVDAKTVATANISSEHQDEYILGFDKSLGNSWVYGAKATYRARRNAIDDTGDQFSIADKMVALGLVSKAEASELLKSGAIPGAVLFNPKGTNVFRIVNPDGGYYSVPMSMNDFGYNTSMKRSYWGFNLYLEHPFDNKWFGRVEYVLSRSYGNSEGQVSSPIGQSSVARTLDWDYAELMDYQNGDLPNDRRHQIKAYGSYLIAPEWRVSGNLMINSGMPRSCLGMYGPDKTNPGLAYGGYYHWCDGKPSSPGEDHNPWNHSLDLGVEYRPSWGDNKLAVALQVNNVFNQQATLQTYPYYQGGNPLWPSIDDEPMPIYWQTPRSFTLSLKYDY